jgi:hypothetical protein
MNFFEEKIMIIRKPITDSSLNLRIPPKLSCPESAQLCQDLGSRETLKCFSTSVVPRLKTSSDEPKYVTLVTLNKLYYNDRNNPSLNSGVKLLNL